MTRLKKILVADDDARIRRPLERILREEGYETLMVGDGEECLRLARSERPDLIVLDVKMPGLDGLSVCSVLKGDPRLADIPVILFSGTAREGDRRRGLALGAVDFIAKPHSSADLVRRVREILADR